MPNQVVDIVNECIAAAKRFKDVLDEESDVLKSNDLAKIAKMNDTKDALLHEFSTVKDKVCELLNIPHRRFDQVNIQQHIDKIEVDREALAPLIESLWDLQHECHNQFIINNNVISARMHYLNKTVSELVQGGQSDKTVYTKSGVIEFDKPSIGKTIA